MAAGAIMSSNGAVPDRGTNLIVMMWILTVGSSITVIMVCFYPFSLVDVEHLGTFQGYVSKTGSQIVHQVPF